MVLSRVNEIGLMQSLHISWEEAVLTLKMEVIDIGLLMRELWFERFEGCLKAFPLYETAVFDLEEGSSCLYAEDGGGQRLYRQDVTNRYKFWESTGIYEFLHNNTDIWLQVRGLLETSAAGKMVGVGPELLPAVAKFPGYKESFYHAIPYNIEDETLPESFIPAAKAIRTPELAIHYFESLEFSKAKTVRKRFFQRPELMFYMKEHLRMFKLLKGDVKMFVTFLDDPAIFDMLQSLHQSPVIFRFCEDYAKICGAVLFLRRLLQSWYMFEDYALYYGTRSEEIQMAMQKQWKGTRLGTLVRERRPAFSIPMSRMENDLSDEYLIDDFRFTLMKTSREYFVAAQELKNCLWSYTSSRNPVYLIRDRHFTAVGAVEVEGMEVVQARAAENKALSTCEGLQEAYDEFLSRTGLLDEPEWHRDDMDDEELPFN